MDTKKYCCIQYIFRLCGNACYSCEQNIFFVWHCHTGSIKTIEKCPLVTLSKRLVFSACFCFVVYLHSILDSRTSHLHSHLGGYIIITHPITQPFLKLNQLNNEKIPLFLSTRCSFFLLRVSLGFPKKTKLVLFSALTILFNVVCIFAVRQQPFCKQYAV